MRIKKLKKHNSYISKFIHLSLSLCILFFSNCFSTSAMERKHPRYNPGEVWKPMALILDNVYYSVRKDCIQSTIPNYQSEKKSNKINNSHTIKTSNIQSCDSSHSLEDHRHDIIYKYSVKDNSKTGQNTYKSRPFSYTSPLPPLENEIEDKDAYIIDLGEINETLKSGFDDDTNDETENIILPNFKDKDDSFFIGLSIDGGGMRGLIPAIFLRDIEETSKKPIHKLFDCIGGTSIGGILALSCVATSDGENPMISTTQLINLFWDWGNKIFNKGYLHQRIYRRFSQLITNQYSPAPLENLLDLFFGDTNLSSALTPVLITASVIPEGATFTFESNKAKESPKYDFLNKDVARATSAAPTYFPASSFSDLAGDKEYQFVDGGIWLNNPSNLIYNRMITQRHNLNLDNDIVVVSLGTGHCPINYQLNNQTGLLRAAPAVIETMMNTSNHGVCQEMKGLLGNNFLRYQPSLDEIYDLADSEPRTLLKLEEAASDKTSQIEELSRYLLENYNRRHPASLQ